MAILEAYFDVEDGEEENLAPAVAEGGAWGRVGACVAHGLLRCSGLNPGLAVPNPHPAPAPRTP